MRRTRRACPGVHPDLVGVFKHFGVGESVVHIVILFEKVKHRLHTLLHHLFHCLFRIELWVLFKIAHRVAWRENHIALIALVDAGYNFKKS